MICSILKKDKGKKIRIKVEENLETIHRQCLFDRFQMQRKKLLYKKIYE